MTDEQARMIASGVAQAVQVCVQRELFTEALRAGQITAIALAVSEFARREVIESLSAPGPAQNFSSDDFSGHRDRI